MKKVKKLLCITLSACMALSVIGCGKDDKKSSEGSAVSSDSAKNNYADLIFAKDDSFKGVEIKSIDNLNLVGSDLYVLGHEYNESSENASPADASTMSDAVIDEGMSDATYYLKKQSVDGESQDIATISGQGDIQSIFYFGDGTPYIINSLPDGILSELDGDKMVRANEAMTAIINQGSEFSQSIINDKDGNVVVLYNNSVICYDKSGAQKYSFKLEDSINAIAMDKDGNVVVVYSKGDESNSEKVFNAKVYDTASKSFKSDDYPINVSNMAYSDLFSGSGKYDFFYKTSTVIYGYSYADKKETAIMDMDLSDIDSNQTMRITVADEETFYATEVTEDSESGKEKVVRYKKVPAENVKDRKILTVATTLTHYGVRDAAKKFNESQDEIKIKILDYSEEADANAKLSADISAGNIPDMYVLADGIAGMTIDQAISKGYIEDLTPFLEKDSELSKEDFIPSVYNTMCRDGKLYFVADSFRVNAIIGNADEIGSEPGWTFTEFKDYVFSKPEEAKICWSTSKNKILETYFSSKTLDFVDWDKGECHFDSPEFKALLEVCNRGTMEDSDPEVITHTGEDIKSGKQLFITESIGNRENKMYLYKKVFKNVAIKGFPSANGKGFQASFNAPVAMSSGCSDKDAAWKFLRYYLTEKRAGEIIGYGYGIPVREDAYAEFMKGFTATSKGTDKYGNEFLDMSGEQSLDDITAPYEPMTEDELKEYRKIIDNIDSMETNDNHVMSIVNEDVQAYFLGDKSLDDTCKIIQDRVTTYVNENK